MGGKVHSSSQKHSCQLMLRQKLSGHNAVLAAKKKDRLMKSRSLLSYVVLHSLTAVLQIEHRCKTLLAHTIVDLLADHAQRAIVIEDESIDAHEAA